MKIDIGEYRIETDERNFILSKQYVVEESRLVKKENIGDIRYKELGYFSSLDSCLKNISRNVVMVNDDVMVIMDKLSEIDKEIESLNAKLSLKEELNYE